ncbi:MAG: hypothetical protein M1830_003100 [Pleopsidium flavum]|nr:MAG: hypothetical protein M1830_003100 [Pleopsidium flavum]
MSTATNEPRYKLIFTVPHSSRSVCKDAIFAVGAGTYPGGKYTNVCFEIPGVGQFIPGDGAKPNIGAVGKLEHVEEMRVEILCVGRDVMLEAVEALKSAHPYEEVAYEVYKMEDV